MNLLNAMQANQIVLVILLVAMVVILVVLPMFTNKKRMKATQELHNAIQVGTVIKTVGGIVGTVVEVKEISPVDKNLIVETGVEGSKSTMEFDIQAVYQVLSGAKAPAVEPAKEEKKVDAKPIKEEKVEEPKDDKKDAQ